MRKHRGNQNKLYQTVLQQFILEEMFEEINKGTRNSVSPVVRSRRAIRLRRTPQGGAWWLCHRASSLLQGGGLSPMRLRRRTAAFAAVTNRKTKSEH